MPMRTPVVMYHAVGFPVPGWSWPALTTPLELFQKQVSLLAGRGYRSINLDEYRELTETGRQGREPQVVMTFDDGYLDNWVFAYPILKKAGWRGTIYVNPEFVDPGEEPRPNLEDVWSGKLALGDLQSHGFLNRGELRVLQQSGVMEIASHSMSHTWWPTGPEVKDYHRPGLNNPWLAWNARPERKFAYLTEDQQEFVPWGTPVHQSGRALGIRRYLPSDNLTAACVEHVRSRGGSSFFDSTGWRQELDDVARPFADEGRFETDAELDARYRHEIMESKRILEDIVGEPVRHFCFPGGAYCDASWAVAEEAGFRTICLASKKDPRRAGSDDPRLVRRISCWNTFSFRGQQYLTTDPAFLSWDCDRERGKTGVKWAVRLRKILIAASQGFNP
jgi:peptidoglycan/xylan/chitin deacetylase (PgdA/CDA1 family)